ncbi:hypothetical protein CEXT_137561 [Caerostris extrusa]|uniref:Uncharacterized protein n=1 Tax=Caerostris extrusa TaxID=172846 RepID=A0AAV4NBX2_CAEEX|nr:hypothetical protein CEXT_137561 [Caerostris extrusa]
MNLNSELAEHEIIISTLCPKQHRTLTSVSFCWRRTSLLTCSIFDSPFCIFGRLETSRSLENPFPVSSASDENSCRIEFQINTLCDQVLFPIAKPSGEMCFVALVAVVDREVILSVALSSNDVEVQEA